jgi:hypothetical protein
MCFVLRRYLIASNFVSPPFPCTIFSTVYTINFLYRPNPIPQFYRGHRISSLAAYVYVLVCVMVEMKLSFLPTIAIE